MASNHTVTVWRKVRLLSEKKSRRDLYMPILVLALQGTAYSVLIVFSLSLLAMNMHTPVNIKLNLEIEFTDNFNGTKHDYIML